MKRIDRRVPFKKILFLCLLITLLAFSHSRPAPKPSRYKLSKPIVLTGIHNKVISGLSIKGAGSNCIQLTNCYNIIIKDCRLTSSKQNGIEITNCQNIKVVNCYFEDDATGVYAYKSTGVAVNNNRFKNMLGPVPKGQAVQFNAVYGKGNRINFNKCQNTLGAGSPEDAINLFETNGTIADLVQVIGNRIRGGGPSKTGGGIMLGDNGGSYIIAKGNVLVDPGQYGMAIAGGSHITITSNKIYGRQQPFTNVGLYIWNQSADGCAENIISYNQVNFTNAKGESNHSWDNGNCGPVTGWRTNTWGAKLSGKLLPLNIINQ